jgi:hypothetical protein
MGKIKLVSSTWKANWCVDLWSDGSMHVWSSYARYPNITHVLPKGASVVNGYLPQYAIALIQQARRVK